MKKHLYNPPIIEVYIIELEETLAQGSTNITFGGDNPNYIPEIEDWEDTETNTQGGFVL